jgi:hypothetical protein
MNIKSYNLSHLEESDKYRLSYPLKPELYNELREKLSPLPLLIVNKDNVKNSNEIVFGLDYYRYLVSQNAAEATALQVEMTEKEALLLACNLKEKLTGFNTYEKLIFIHKMSALLELPSQLPELYRKTNLDINISTPLLKNLQLLVGEPFRQVLMDEVVSLKSAIRLCGFGENDRLELLDLFTAVSFSSSHQLKILEMAEELIFRDKATLKEIFAKLEIPAYLEIEKPQKTIIDALFKYRFPEYSEAELRWEKELKTLKLPSNARVTHYPFFEKRQVEVTLPFADAAKLKDFFEEKKE